MSNSIEYYDENGQAFFDRTVNLEMGHIHETFLSLLTKKAHILDAGCGSGRDAKHFIEQGYKVTAFDGSSEMVKRAQAHLGQNILQLQFQAIDFHQEFDGVWACASLLHVPYDELRGIMEKIHASLKATGIFYASFKYGNSKRPAGSRDFYDMDENLIVPHVKGLFETLKAWKTDQRSNIAPSPTKEWLNLLYRKIS